MPLPSTKFREQTTSTSSISGRLLCGPEQMAVRPYRPGGGRRSVRAHREVRPIVRSRNLIPYVGRSESWRGLVDPLLIAVETTERNECWQPEAIWQSN